MKRKYFLYLVFFLFVSQSCSVEKPVINNLKVEYTAVPLGIDVETPRFSWQMQTLGDERGCYQTAYQIVVKGPDEEITWDSKKIKSSTALAIKYKGSPLKASTRYHWTVTVWDQNDVKLSADSWFETGLMNTDIFAWNGAEWIGGSDKSLVFYPDYLPLFKMKYSLAINKGSSKAGFVYGANDIRLMDKYKNIYLLENKHNESYIKLELDISEVENNGLAKINIYRAGYAPEDNPTKPIKSFDIKSSVINSKNKNAKHNFDIISEFGRITVTLDGNPEFFIRKEEENPNLLPWMQQAPGASFSLNPLGSGGDVIPFGMVCEIGFAMEPGQKAKFSGLEILNHRKPNNTLFKEDLSSGYNGIYKGKVKVKDNSYILEGDEQGTFVVADPGKNSIPMLRKEFETAKKVISARLYITARGIYEVYINSKKVGKDYYNPGQTQYNKSHFYQTYDVTDMLQNGTNAIGVIMAEGWWSGLLSFGSVWNHFGDRQSLLADLQITYSDGSKENIVTNKSWSFYNNGPIVYSSLDMGEVYDAAREKKIAGWTRAGFDDSEWEKVSIVPLEGTTFSGEERDFNGAITSFNFKDTKLKGQIGNNAVEYKILTAKSVKEVRDDVFVYDMGQNFVGVPRISIVNGIAGNTMILRYAEMLYPDLEESGNNVGMIMTENYRAALCQDIYIMKQGKQVFQPKFTSRGYQYIEITGIKEPLPLESVQGVAISSLLEVTADYKTSNKKVNKLWSNLVWSNIDNFLTLPTDCPQRNERMGWSGDISVFSRTATYVSNADQFLRRHMVAMRDVQNESGKFTDVAPIGGGFGGILWGSAGLTVPWEAYRQYNDVSLLEEHYDAMVSYIDHLDKSIDDKTGMSSDVQLGDWLGPQNNRLGTQYLATAYHVYDLWIMKNTAEILGRSKDAERFARMLIERKNFFNKTFVNEEKKTKAYITGGFTFGAQPSKPEFKTADTQTSYAVGLALGTFDDEIIHVMAKNLAETVKRKNIDDNNVLQPEYSLMTGFIGTAWISKSLSDFGYNEEAYRLLQSEHYPSWLYPINQGATSIWERLNGYTVENGFGGNNGMNSFNHYSFGAVGQWMIAYSLGIQRDEPGFQKFILQPIPDPSGKMTWAEGYYDSMYGRIYSRWKVEDGRLIYKASVPANTTATLYLPANSENDVIDADGCTLIGFKNGKAVYELKSGKYKFESNL